MPDVDVTRIVRTKLPDTVVSGDDCVLTRRDIEYHPHAGETVTFSGEPSWAELDRSVRVQYLIKLGQPLWSLDESKDMVTLAQSLIDDLARHIAAWTWSDGQGDPLPSPPSAEALSDLPAPEIIWLILSFAGTSAE